MKWLLATLAASCGWAQSAQLPAIELASLKLSSPDEHVIGMFVYPGGRITVSNYTLRMLIHEAWQVEDFQIDGGPKWADQDRYSIVARPPADSKSSKVNPPNPKLPPPDEERMMLRALLAERFGLVVHEEERDGPVLARCSPWWWEAKAQR
jgi:uncharacterized protein (TIGR03435 family)